MKIVSFLLKLVLKILLLPVAFLLRFLCFIGNLLMQLSLWVLSPVMLFVLGCGIYGKLVYTYTCHFKMADRLSKRNFWIKWGQIGLSAISTGGFLGVLISNEQILLWAGGLCSTALLALTSYLKDKDISTEKTDHIKTANKLWKVREKYLSLLTDFDEISIEEIVRKRDELLDESSEIYCAAPLTDGKSYAAAQAALKTNEEQFFTQEELNKMLPAHLRKNE